MHVELRPVQPADLPIHYENQANPDAVAMGEIPTRDRPSFDEHWAKVLVDPEVIIRTIVADGEVAGAVQSWPEGGVRLSGYMIGQRFWGRGIATAAMAQFLEIDTHRPLHADVAKSNFASIRVLEKSGYTLDHEHDNGFHYVLAAP